jgi:peptidoglycan/LPS O-acetylase OafA/YrhL
MAVVAFHLGLSWAPGGLLGVGVFFTLSGYLITDLLLHRWSRTGSLEMGRFWSARARRLLPALATLLVVVATWVMLAHPGQFGDLAGNIGAAAGYFSNWWLIFRHQSYFARFGPPSPLGHLWSLAIEEQFYLVWPWLLLLLLKALRQRWTRAAITTGLAAMSATEMALLWHPGIDPTRVYDGTDTRAFALLLGASLAFVWPSRVAGRLRARRVAGVLDIAGAAALVGIVVMITTVGQYSSFLYLGGLGLLSVATVVVIAAVVHPGSRLGRLLGCRPLKWIGVRSYGIYLWHYPIVVLTQPALGRSESLGRSLLQVLATTSVAVLSWRFVEDPIRTHGWRHFWAQLRHGPRLPTKPALPAISGIAAAGALMVLTLAAPPSHRVVMPSSLLANSATSSGPSSSTTSDSVVTVPNSSASNSAASNSTIPDSTVPRSVPSGSTTTASTDSGSTTSTAAPTGNPSAAIESATTSCRSVVHIGDSTSESLVSPDYLPNPALRLDAQYRRVGVAKSVMEISGARSIVETYDQQPNGFEVAQTLVHGGYRGCWVIALGTNDTANIFVGSNVQEQQRIERMMSVIGPEPVMWVDTASLLASGPYSAANMRNWNQGLVAACHRYPNMRVYDWASQAQPSWFISDGIHYSTPGSAHRSTLIASALAAAFPAHGESSGCVVR